MSKYAGMLQDKYNKGRTILGLAQSSGPDRLGVTWLDMAEVTGWAVSALDMLIGIFGRENVRVQEFQAVYHDPARNDARMFERFLAVIDYAIEDLDQGYVFEQRAIEQLRNLARTIPNLTDDERGELARAGEELVLQTPGKDRAARRFKELFQQAGSEVYGVAKQILTNVLTAAALQQLDL